MKLVGAQPGSAYMVGDADNLYWGNYSSGEILKIAKAGGAAVVLATGQFSPIGLSIDANAVYWTNYDGDTVERVSLDGTNASTIAAGQFYPSASVVDSGTIYWTTFDGDVQKADTDGANLVPLVGGHAGASAITVDATSLYVVDYAVGGGAVWRADLDGSNYKSLATGQIYAGFCALDAGHVYWTAGGDVDGTPSVPGTVMRVDKDGKNPILIATDPTNHGFPSGVAVDATTVYWTNATGNAVVSAPIDGGTPKVLATGQNYPVGIVVDDKAIYWANFDYGNANGSIMKLAK